MALLFLTVSATNGQSQTVIDPKGTRIQIDTSKWELVNADIFNKNEGNVGVGTKGMPNANAALEVKATNRGLLIPRLALTQTSNPNPLSTHVAGMVVYNTATTGDVTPGVYYDDGSRWRRAGASSTADTTNDAWKDDHLNQQVRLAYKSDGGAREQGTEFVIKNSGQVGIGTAAPGATLHLNAKNGAEALRISSNLTEDNSPDIFFVGNQNGDGTYSLRRVSYNNMRDSFAKQAPALPRIAVNNSGAEQTISSNNIVERIDLTTVWYNHSSDMFTFNNAANEIVINQPGVFEVRVYFGFSNIPTFEGDILCSVLRNGSVYTSTILSRSANNVNYVGSAAYGLSAVALLELNTGDKIALAVNRIGSTNVVTHSGGMTILIEKVR